MEIKKDGGDENSYFLIILSFVIVQKVFRSCVFLYNKGLEIEGGLGDNGS